MSPLWWAVRWKLYHLRWCCLDWWRCCHEMRGKWYLGCFFYWCEWRWWKGSEKRWKVWCWSWTRGGFVWCLWKKGRKNYGYVLLLFLKKLIHIIGLCFSLSSFSQWISPLFIKVERRVWGAYLAWIVTLNSNGKDTNCWSKITITS